jgi:cytochrome c-type biogenesis protein CcmH/NrfF
MKSNLFYGKLTLVNQRPSKRFQKTTFIQWIVPVVIVILVTALVMTIAISILVSAR